MNSTRNSQELFAAGREALVQGRVDEARESLSRAAELQPDNANIHGALAAACYQASDLQGAIRAIRCALDLNPASSRFARLAGVYHLKVRDASTAERYFRQAIDLDADSSAAWSGLARALYEQGQLDEAAEILSRLVATDKELATSNRLLAEIAAAEGDLSRAVEHADKLVNLVPTSVSSHVLLGSFHVRRGNLEEALVAYRRAVELSPNDASTGAIVRELERMTGSSTDRATSFETRPTEASPSYYDDVYELSRKYAIRGDSVDGAPHWEAAVYWLRSLPIEHVIDIGCGPGQFAEYLRSKLPYTYLGVDFSTVAIDQARARMVANASFVQSDVLNNSLPHFDVAYAITALEVLEHINNDLLLIKKLPAGVHCIFSVPNFFSFSHVRWFNSEAEVRERYGEFFAALEVRRCPLNEKGRCLYIFSGRREDRS